MAIQTQQDQSADVDLPAAITKRDRVKFLTQQVKQTARDRLHHDHEQPNAQEDGILEDAAFDPQKILQKEPPAKPSLRDRLSIGAKSFGRGIRNPKSESRNNYTRTAVAKIANHPHDLGVAFDDELLEAHDALTRATEQRDEINRNESVDFISSAKTETSNVDDAQSRLDHVQQQRQDLQIGWILGRQVARARVVQPMPSKPDRAQFLVPSDQPGQPPHLRWERYLGHLVLWYTNSFTAHRIDDYDEPPFDLRELALTFERLAAVTTPWQTFYSRVRDIYRWEDPRRTMLIMLAYWILWYLQHIATFAIGFVIYTTVRERLHQTTIQTVRERLKRSRDQTERVRTWGELIQRHGEHDWIEPFLDNVGPPFQLQMADLSTYLERLLNLYRWERPQQTRLTLIGLSCCFLFSLLTSMESCVRMVWFAAGCYFFFTCPIATNYPKYRRVVSPFNWIIWGIPDMAELAISQLQEKTVARDASRLAELKDKEQDSNFAGEVSAHKVNSYSSPMDPVLPDPHEPYSSHSSDSTLLHKLHDSDTLTFRTVLLPDHAPAEVTLTRTHIVLKQQQQPPISHPYTSLLEMTKVEISTNSNQSSSSTDTNHLSRSQHLTTWLEKATGAQMLPDGLGFVFSQEDARSSNHDHDHDHLQDHQVSSTPNQAIDKAPLPAANPPSNPFNPNPPPPTQTPLLPKPSNDKHKPPQKTQVTLILNKADRDKIFTVVLGWSNLQWQPLFSINRQNRLGNRKTKGEGNSNLDDAIKKALS